MRSWNSDDSNFLAASCEARSEIACRSGAAKRARLCRNARIDDPTESVVVVIVIDGFNVATIINIISCTTTIKSQISRSGYERRGRKVLRLRVTVRK